jgi:hypothetical protein
MEQMGYVAYCPISYSPGIPVFHSSSTHYSYEIPIKHLLFMFLVAQGAGPSINQSGNSALACVLRHVRDWEFRYELLDMLLQHGGNPNVVGRDGSVPLMVCLVPLINKDPLHHFTHTMKV